MLTIKNLSNLKLNVTLAPYTTYQVGGKADYFLTVISKEQLVEAVTAAKTENVPYFILGLGANILISDKGFRGLVIKNEAAQVKLNGTQLYAQSGARIADLISLTANKGLSGLEHYAGIPSTIGGALWQNLHFLAPDRKSTSYIAEIVQSAEILFPDLKIKQVNRDFFKFDYDQSILHQQPELVVLSVVFNLMKFSSKEIKQRIQANLDWRNAKHPKLSQFPSSGSIFKKITGVGAGRLIDRAGLKGKQVGKAQVSVKHANFIVNLGGATAMDIYQLILLVQKEVFKTSGYKLVPEIRLVGEWELAKTLNSK